MQAENPSGSDLNALALYIMSCLIFIVAALIEFAIVVLVSRSSKTMNRKTKDPLTTSNAGNNTDEKKHNIKGNQGSSLEVRDYVECETKNGGQGEMTLTLPQKWLIYVISNINSIDLVAFCVYLFLFVLFNGIYWQVYL